VSAGIRLLAGACFATAALAGCGGASGVAPAKYVHAMCGALAGWRSEITSAGAKLQSSGAANATRDVAKRDYQQFISSLLAATERAAGALKSAGKPSVGTQLADRLANAFDGATHNLTRATAQAGAISTASVSTFQLGASSVTAQIRTALERIAAVKPSQNVALRTAAARDPACQVLRG
jgi:hypothetical protein